MSYQFPQMPYGQATSNPFDDPRMAGMLPSPDGAPQPPMPQAPQAPQAPAAPAAARPPNANGIDPEVVKLMLAQGGQSASKMKIARQQKMADAMRSSAMQLNDPKGQMVGGRYIGPNIGTALIGAGQGYLANRADDKAAAMAGENDAARAEAMRRYFEQFQGGGV